MRALGAGDRTQLQRRKLATVTTYRRSTHELGVRQNVHGRRLRIKMERQRRHQGSGLHSTLMAGLGAPHRYGFPRDRGDSRTRAMPAGRAINGCVTTGACGRRCKLYGRGGVCWAWCSLVQCVQR